MHLVPHVLQHLSSCRSQPPGARLLPEGPAWPRRQRHHPRRHAPQRQQQRLPLRVRRARVPALRVPHEEPLPLPQRQRDVRRQLVGRLAAPERLARPAPGERPSRRSDAHLKKRNEGAPGLCACCSASEVAKTPKLTWYIGTSVTNLTSQARPPGPPTPLRPVEPAYCPNTWREGSDLAAPAPLLPPRCFLEPYTTGFKPLLALRPTLLDGNLRPNLNHTRSSCCFCSSQPGSLFKEARTCSILSPRSTGRTLRPQNSCKGLALEPTKGPLLALLQSAMLPQQVYGHHLRRQALLNAPPGLLTSAQAAHFGDFGHSSRSL